MAGEVRGPWDRLRDAADAWDHRTVESGEQNRYNALVDPLAAMLRRQAARSAMYAHDLTNRGVPRELAHEVIESDADFMVADAAASALKALLS